MPDPLAQYMTNYAKVEMLKSVFRKVTNVRGRIDGEFIFSLYHIRKFEIDRLVYFDYIKIIRANIDMRFGAIHPHTWSYTAVLTDNAKTILLFGQL